MSQLVSTVDLIEWSEIKQRNKLIEWLARKSYRIPTKPFGQPDNDSRGD